MKKEYLLISILSLFIVNIALAKPRISTVFGKSLDDFSRIKVINETTDNLICYVAIDGRKIKFRLASRGVSRWYKATDKRFNYTHFRAWCDYAEP